MSIPVTAYALTFVICAAAAARVLLLRVFAREEPLRVAEKCSSSSPTSRITQIWIYPVKSMRGYSVPACELDAKGIVYDRRYLVIDGNNRFVTQRGMPALATIVPHLEVPADSLLKHVDCSPAVRPSLAGTSRPVLVLTVEPLAANSFCTIPPLSVPLVTSADIETGSEKGSKLAGTCLRDVIIWDSTVEATVDQGDAAAAWLCTVLGRPDLRLVKFDEGSAGEGGGCLRAITGSIPPEPGPGFSTEVAFADGFPLLILGESSVAALNDRLPADADPIPLGRFRTNLVVAGRGHTADSTVEPLPAFDEDTWHTVAVGPTGVLLRGCKLCGRCRITTTDQHLGTAAVPRQGELEAEPLVTLRKFRRAGAEALMGLNASPQWDAAGGVGLRWRPRSDRVIRVGDSVHVLERAMVPPALTPV